MSTALFSPKELSILRSWAPSGQMTHIEPLARQDEQMALRDKLDALLRILYPEGVPA